MKFPSRARRSTKKRHNSRGLHPLEALEDRRLLASDGPMITEYDVATGTSTSYPAPANDQFLELENEARMAGYDGLIDLLGIGTPTGPQDPFALDPEVDALKGTGPESIFGADGRTRINPTTGFPWRTIGLTASVFPGVNGWSWCSAAAVGPFHILLAAHCVRNATTDANPNAFANNLEYVAASNGQRFSTTEDPDNGTQSTDRPYGTANATFFRAYTWNNTSWDYDIALVTLDRNVGSYTGWMGYGWNTDDNLFQNQTLNAAGYPGDLNDTNSDGNRDTQYMYHGADPITSVTSHQLRSNQLDTWPGQSGGPLWRYVSSTQERTIYGVTSHQNASYNGWTRITQDKFDNLIVAGMNADAVDRPPTDRADLIDWDRWFNTTTQFMNSSFTVPGGNFSVTMYPRNNGTASSGNYSVTFYASTNSTISTFDYPLGTVNMGSLSPFQWGTATLNVAFPNSVPAGQYYVGWIIDSGGSVSEFLEGNNTGYLPNLLTVGTDDHGAGPAGATQILARSTTNGVLEAPGDDDWFYFEASAGAQVTLETQLGSLADTVLRLYGPDGVTLVAIDDDGGPGFASLINYTVPAAGFYYASVRDFADDDVGSYSLSLNHVDDHGQSTSFSTLTGSNQVLNGDLEVGGDVDWFTFFVSDGAQVTLETTLGTLGDSILRLFGSDGVTQLALDDDGGVGFASRIDYTFATGGQYFVQVEDFGNPNPGSYSLSLTHVDDHPQSAIGATQITAYNTSYGGDVEVDLDRDFFSFDATAGVEYTLKTYLTGTLSDSTLTLYDTDGTSVLAYNDDDGVSLASSITWTAPATGTYFLGVAGFSVRVGTYEVAVLAPATIDGDFNDDGMYDCSDINALVAEIAGGTNQANYDLTGDTLVDLADRDAWLTEAGSVNLPSGNPYLLGDANLDGAVDGSDFGIWNSSKFTSVAAWCSGDFTADGVVDGSDFGAWNSNKFTSSARALRLVPKSPDKSADRPFVRVGRDAWFVAPPTMRSAQGTNDLAPSKHVPWTTPPVSHTARLVVVQSATRKELPSLTPSRDQLFADYGNWR